MRLFEKYKIEILDMKTAVGKLSGTGGDVQFFCAALVQSDSDAIPQSAADTLSKLFHDAGVDDAIALLERGQVGLHGDDPPVHDGGDTTLLRVGKDA